MMTKVFVVLTAVLAVAVSCLFIATAAQWENWRGVAQARETERDAAIAEKMNAQFTAQAAIAVKDQALRDTSRALADAQADKQSLADELAKSKGDLAKARNEALAFEAGRTKLQEILGVTTGERNALQKQNQDLVAQNIDLQTRITRMNSRNLDLTTSVTILTDQIRNLQEKLYATEQQLLESQQRVAAGRTVPAEPDAPTKRGRPRRRSFARDYAEAILIAVVASFFLRAFVVQAFKIPSGSMKRTLLVGDYVIVEKLSYRFGAPSRGDVIVFKYPHQDNDVTVGKSPDRLTFRIKN